MNMPTDPNTIARAILYNLSDRELKELWYKVQELHKSSIKDAQKSARSFLPTRRCAWCGDDFIVRNSLSMYCCKYHKQLAYEKRKSERLILVSRAS